MFKCNCDREFNSQKSLNSHARFCDKYVKADKPKSEYKVTENLYRCECGKEFDNCQSLNGHLGHCVVHRKGKAPDYSKRCVKGYMAGWADKTNEEIANIRKKAGKKYSDNIKSGKRMHNWTNKKHTEKSKNKISKSRTKYLKNNHNHGIEWYKVSNGEKIINVQGKWEKTVAEWLNTHNIKWDRRTLIFDSHRRYTPDFYLIDYKCYIEVKGYMKDQDMYKMLACQSYHSIKILLVEHKQLKNITNLSVRSLPNFNDVYCFNDINFKYINTMYNFKH